MPNGDYHEDRKLWERVRDMQKEFRACRISNGQLRDEVKRLKEENEKLSIALGKAQIGLAE